MECVDKFEYLEANINVAWDCMAEISKRLAIAYCKLTRLKNIWKNNKIETKLLMLRTFIFLVATYGCETWTLSKTAAKKINAFKMKCYRNILRILWKEKLRYYKQVEDSRMLVTKHNSKKKTTPVWSYKETQLFRKTNNGGQSTWEGGERADQEDDGLTTLKIAWICHWKMQAVSHKTEKGSGSSLGR